MNFYTIIKIINTKVIAFFFSVLIPAMTIAQKTTHWTNRYDIEWTSPSEHVNGNMPLGAGDMACNVWVEGGDLLFYIQRSGSFNEIGEVIKMGRVRLTLSPNPFIKPQFFSQKLVLNDGYITIKAKGNKSNNDFEVRIKMWVDQFTHSVNLDIDSDKEIDYKVAYENWRYEDKLLVEDEYVKTQRWSGLMKNPSPLAGCFSFVEAPFDVMKYKDEFSCEDNHIQFYHRNAEETLSPNFAIEQQGLTKYKDEIPNAIKNRTIGGKIFGENLVPAEKAGGRYLATPYRSVSLKTTKSAKKHHLFVVTHVDQKENLSDWKNELDDLCRVVKETKGDFNKNRQWWNDFWQRSWIVISPDKKDETSKMWQLGRNYNLVRYQFGGNAYGEFPTKFNGGNLGFDQDRGYDPDWRRWGGDFHTAQNQRHVYWPMLKSGDFDAMHSQFNLYQWGLKGAMIRVKEHFGHEGAQFSENTDPSGLHMPISYGFKTSYHGNDRSMEVPFGHPDFATVAKPNVPIEVGVQNNTGQAYHYNSQLEFSYMMLQYYNYSGQSIEKYMPIIKQSVLFFDKHYQKRKIMRDGKPLDKNGKLVIFPSQALESYRGNVTNPTDLISGLRACLNSLIDPDFHYVSKEDKKYYKSFLKRIPKIPFGKRHNQNVMKPAEKFEGSVKSEMPQFYPLFPYNLYSCLDEEMEVFTNTWKYDERLQKGKVGAWHHDGIFLARMQMLDECLEHQFGKLAGTTNGYRYPTYWGPGDGLPDHNRGGAGMVALQEMVMQTPGDQILILPTWPKNVDVNFKLHAPQNTTVEVSYKNGIFEQLKVTPSSRKKDVTIMINK